MALNRGRSHPLGALLTLKTAIAIACILLVGWFSAAFALDNKQVFLPGETSVGHHLFEASCSSCHEGFKAVTNETCNRCHGAELAEDKHGASKFRDPRWAGELAKLEALTCTTCHNEHVHMSNFATPSRPVPKRASWPRALQLGRGPYHRGWNRQSSPRL
ncbi:MAG: cytochrome c3 family protein [Cyanobacteria bacterium P01_D01_bin.128]